MREWIIDVLPMIDWLIVLMLLVSVCCAPAPFSGYVAASDPGRDCISAPAPVLLFLFLLTWRP